MEFNRGYKREDKRNIKRNLIRNGVEKTTITKEEIISLLEKQY